MATSAPASAAASAPPSPSPPPSPLSLNSPRSTSPSALPASTADGVTSTTRSVADITNGVASAADSVASAADGVASATDGVASAADSVTSTPASSLQSEPVSTPGETNKTVLPASAGTKLSAATETVAAGPGRYTHVVVSPVLTLLAADATLVRFASASTLASVLQAMSAPTRARTSSPTDAQLDRVQNSNPAPIESKLSPDSASGKAGSLTSIPSSPTSAAATPTANPSPACPASVRAATHAMLTRALAMPTRALWTGDPLGSDTHDPESVQPDLAGQESSGGATTVMEALAMTVNGAARSLWQAWRQPRVSDMRVSDMAWVPDVDARLPDASAIVSSPTRLPPPHGASFSVMPIRLPPQPWVRKGLLRGTKLDQCQDTEVIDRIDLTQPK